MTSDRWNQIRAVLDEVAACDPGSRECLLRERFAADSDLRRVIETLLTVGADASTREISGTEATTIALSPAVSPALEDTYGPYVPLRRLGEGGMGTVYLAHQERPIRREVALKVVKLGMDSRQVLDRFELERQTLALMEHPHVARVLDAGTSMQGRPYFVMEFVNGVPIDRYCDRNTLGVRERLKLFLPVCAAIQHAHQKGIIHRDIKPSNILITEIDGNPVPKVIDFGIARATNSRVAECDAFTIVGQIIGTPEYMSPEQADRGTLDIDTTTDVYSLGIVLYELLVGALPIDRGKLRNLPFSEVIRAIRETPIPRPTTRLTQIGAAMAEVARQRSSDPERLKHDLSGDLEWVVMKAVEKDRQRRYPSASEFAADLERALKNEPVAAGPPGAAYRIRKFVARHRFGFVIAAAFLAFLIGAAVVSTTEAIRANRERDRAVAAGREADAEKLAAYAMGSLSDDPERSTILALYAVEATLPFHLGVRPSAENALHRAILSLRSGLAFRGHRSSVIRVNFSPDGVRLLTAGADGAAKIWDAATAAEIGTLPASAQPLTDAAFNADGTRIATADENGVVKVWNAAARSEIFTYRCPALVSTVLFGAGNRIAVISADKTVNVRDGEFGRERFGLKGQISASFSPDGRRILTVSADASAIAWDGASGRRLFRIAGDAISQAAYSPDGAFIATASRAGSVTMWNAADGKRIGALEGARGAAWVVFSPNGRRLAAAASDRKGLVVWDTATRKQICVVRTGKSRLQKAIFSPDAEWIATADSDLAAKVWNASTGEELSPFIYNSALVYDLAFSPDGHRLATGEAASLARLWDLSPPRELLYLDQEMANSVAFSPDGRRIATAASDKTGKVWDAASGRLLLILRGHEDKLTSVAFSTDGSRLVTASVDGTSRVWDAASGTGMLTLRGRQVVVWKAVFSADSRRIATAGTDQTAKVWDAATGRELLSIRSPGRVMDVAFSPDGRLLATGGDEKSVNLWDAASGRLSRRIDDVPKPGGAANLIAFRPDGKRIVTAGGNPIIWDVAAGRKLLTLRGHGKAITAIAFSSDGKRVATGSMDRSAAIWDAETGQQLFVFQHEAPVADVAFSPAGRRVATADADGVQVYALAVEDLMRVARSRITRPLTPAECRNFFQSDACPPLLP
jgi:eukaryotic-like serine/threonine-protein kinase